MALPARSNVPTVVAIAVVAYVAADVVHEVAHAITGRWVGVPLLSISTVALQTAGRSRIMAAAGTSAEVIAGACALASAARRRRFGSTTYLLWLFGLVSAMNVGYLAFSAVTNTGDWAVVIDGLSPPLPWRAAIGALGGVGYAVTVRAAAHVMQRFLDRGVVSFADVRRLTYPAYLAGGALMTVASMFNPIGPSLILLSGAGASFGLTWGLLMIGGMVDAGDASQRASDYVHRDVRWLVAAAVVGAAFVAVLGPGIRIGGR
jgi:hypothetical protein